MTDEERYEKRRAQMATKTTAELREILAMDCVVPLDFALAEMAGDELADRIENGEDIRVSR